MSLSDRHRIVFRQLSALFLPPWENMPDASLLEIESRQLDQVLAVRPELLDSFTRLLDDLHEPVDAQQINALLSHSVADFNLLKLIVCGAYYLHPQVKAALSYSGQQALTLSRGGFGGEEGVMKLMQQSKRFREARNG